MKEARDFFNQEDYDRLVKEGVTKFADLSSLPVPDDPDAVVPKGTSTPVTPMSSQRGGISRRDFFWGGIVLGAAAIGGLAYVSRKEQAITGEIIAAKPTTAPVPPTQVPTTAALPALKPAEARPIQVPTPVPIVEVKPTQAPTIVPTIEAKSTPILMLTPEQAKLVEARNIFGEYFFGPEAVEKTFGISLKSEEIPKIQFDKSELERAKELGQFLILRLDKEPDGSALTMQYIGQKLKRQFEEGVLNEGSFSRYRYDYFFAKEVPRAKWALVSDHIITSSQNQDYLRQTQTLASYIEGDIYQGRPPKAEYLQAIAAFDSRRNDIEWVLRRNSGEGAKSLVQLKLNLIARQTMVEALYDSLVYFKQTGKPFLGGMGAWVNTQVSDGGIFKINWFAPKNMYFEGKSADRGDYNLGVCPSLLYPFL